MIVVYRISGGIVVETTGTNSTMPEGPSDQFVEQILLPSIADRFGGVKEHYGVVRLHDINHKATVDQIMASDSVVYTNGTFSILGRIQISADSQLYDENELITITATPPNGYGENAIVFRINEATGISKQIANGVATFLCRMPIAGVYTISCSSAAGLLRNSKSVNVQDALGEVPKELPKDKTPVSQSTSNGITTFERRLTRIETLERDVRLLTARVTALEGG